jgi:hypothetical protein
MNAGSPTVALPICVALSVAFIVAHANESPIPPAASPPTGQTAGATAVGIGVETLAGRWIVDLRPSPDAPKYEKQMMLDVAPDGSVRGSFYDSTIDAGRASASNGRTCFAFRTTDGVGPYHTSGCLIGNRILGQTWAEHRKFVLNWTAERE